MYWVCVLRHLGGPYSPHSSFSHTQFLQPRKPTAEVYLKDSTFLTNFVEQRRCTNPVNSHQCSKDKTFLKMKDSCFLASVGRSGAKQGWGRKYTCGCIPRHISEEWGERNKTFILLATEFWESFHSKSQLSSQMIHHPFSHL